MLFFIKKSYTVFANRKKVLNSEHCKFKRRLEAHVSAFRILVFVSSVATEGVKYSLFPQDFPLSIALIEECCSHSNILCCALEMRHTEKGCFN